MPSDETDAVERVRNLWHYAAHRENCAEHTDGPDTCDCGLTSTYRALLSRLDRVEGDYRRLMTMFEEEAFHRSNAESDAEKWRRVVQLVREETALTIVVRGGNEFDAAQQEAK